MKLQYLLTLFAVFLLPPANVFGQIKAPRFDRPAPGNITLLPGYAHEAREGVDSTVGQIGKPGGLTVNYDIGPMAATYVHSVVKSEKQNIVWLKTQRVNGQQLSVLLLENGQIYATFADSFANFVATVKTEGELTDFLLTVMTYGSAAPPADGKKTK